MRDSDDRPDRFGTVAQSRLLYDESIENSDYFHVSTQPQNQRDYAAPFTTDQYKTWVRRWLGRLGLDFVVFVVRYIAKQWDVSCFGTSLSKTGSSHASIMSRTGFVTFLDLASTTTAASAPLNSNRSNIRGGPVEATLAPEPRVRSVRKMQVYDCRFLFRYELEFNTTLCFPFRTGNHMGQRACVKECNAPT
jgi:hypothetical protein